MKHRMLFFSLLGKGSFSFLVFLFLILFTSGVHAADPTNTAPFNQPSSPTTSTLFDILNSNPPSSADASSFTTGITKFGGPVEVAGLKVSGSNIRAGMVLTAVDSTGKVEWRPLPDRLPFANKDGQTIRWTQTGRAWLASDFLFNTGARVGIGTQSPETTLEVNGTGHLATSTVRIADLRNGKNPEFQLQYGANSASEHWALYVKKDSGGGNSLRVWGGGDDRFIIMPNGSIGIGRVPSSDSLKLDVSGSLRVGNQFIYKRESTIGVARTDDMAQCLCDVTPLGKDDVSCGEQFETANDEGDVCYDFYSDPVSADDNNSSSSGTPDATPGSGAQPPSNAAPTPKKTGAFRFFNTPVAFAAPGDGSGPGNNPADDTGAGDSQPTPKGDKGIPYRKQINTTLLPTLFVDSATNKTGIGRMPSANHTVSVSGTVYATEYCIAGVCRRGDTFGLWKATGTDIYRDVGAVGIGKKPDYPFDIVWDTANINNPALVRLNTGSMNVGSSTGVFLEREKGQRKWFFGMIDNSNGLRIQHTPELDDFIVNTDGFVGIGTSNPRAQLSVYQMSLPFVMAGTAKSSTKSSQYPAPYIIGDGTKFSSELAPGDTIIIGDEKRVVHTENSDTFAYVDDFFTASVQGKPLSIQKPVARFLKSDGSPQMILGGAGNVGIGSLPGGEALRLTVPQVEESVTGLLIDGSFIDQATREKSFLFSSYDTRTGSYPFVVRADGMVGFDINNPFATGTAQVQIGKQEASVGSEGEVVRLLFEPWKQSSWWLLKVGDRKEGSFLTLARDLKEMIVLDTQGRTGIGVKQPESELHVGGNLRVDGTLETTVLQITQASDITLKDLFIRSSVSDGSIKDQGVMLSLMTTEENQSCDDLCPQFEKRVCFSAINKGKANAHSDPSGQERYQKRFVRWSVNFYNQRIKCDDKGPQIACLCARINEFPKATIESFGLGNEPVKYPDNPILTWKTRFTGKVTLLGKGISGQQSKPLSGNEHLVPFESKGFFVLPNDIDTETYTLRAYSGSGAIAEERSITVRRELQYPEITDVTISEPESIWFTSKMRTKIEFALKNKGENPFISGLDKRKGFGLPEEKEKVEFLDGVRWRITFEWETKNHGDLRSDLSLRAENSTRKTVTERKLHLEIKPDDYGLGGCYRIKYNPQTVDKEPYMQYWKEEYRKYMDGCFIYPNSTMSEEDQTASCELGASDYATALATKKYPKYIESIRPDKYLNFCGGNRLDVRQYQCGQNEDHVEKCIDFIDDNGQLGACKIASLVGFFTVVPLVIGGVADIIMNNKGEEEYFFSGRTVQCRASNIGPELKGRLP